VKPEECNFAEQNFGDLSAVMGLHCPHKHTFIQRRSKQHKGRRKSIKA
jgi:hypothetical protein